MKPSVIAVDPRLVGLPADHSAVRGAAKELYADLASISALIVDDSGTPVPNTKGWQQDLLLDASGTAALITSVAQILRVWLQRDRRRCLHATKRVDGKPSIEIDICAEDVSDESIQTALRELSGPD